MKSKTHDKVISSPILTGYFPFGQLIYYIFLSMPFILSKFNSNTCLFLWASLSQKLASCNSKLTTVNYFPNDNAINMAAYFIFLISFTCFIVSILCSKCQQALKVCFVWLTHLYLHKKRNGHVSTCGQTPESGIKWPYCIKTIFLNAQFQGSLGLTQNFSVI